MTPFVGGLIIFGVLFFLAILEEKKP